MFYKKESDLTREVTCSRPHGLSASQSEIPFEDAWVPVSLLVPSTPCSSRADSHPTEREADVRGQDGDMGGSRPHGSTESTVTHGAACSEKPQTSRATPSHPAHEREKKIIPSKWVGKAEKPLTVNPAPPTLSPPHPPPSHLPAPSPLTRNPLYPHSSPSHPPSPSPPTPQQQPTTGRRLRNPELLPELVPHIGHPNFKIRS